MNGATLTLSLLGVTALAGVARGARALTLDPVRRRQLDGMAADLQAFAESAADFGSTLRLADLHAWAARHKVTYVGHAGVRALFKIPEGLLKIEITSPPYLSNAREFELYRDAPASLVRHLHPISASAFDHAWILMPDFDELGSLEQIPGYARDELRSAGLAALRNGDFTAEKKAHTYDTVSDGRRRQQVLDRGRAERAKRGGRNKEPREAQIAREVAAQTLSHLRENYWNDREDVDWTHGGCWAFAKAFRKVFGGSYLCAWYPGVDLGCGEGSDFTLHVGVVLPTYPGLVFDAEGALEADAWAGRHGEDWEGYQVVRGRPLDAKQLFADEDVIEVVVTALRARRAP